MMHARLFGAWLSLVWVLSGCDPTGTPDGGGVDAGALDAGAACDGSCDDGIFCNGAESCVDGRCAPGTPPSCDDGVACTVDACSEAARGCSNLPPDADDDGFGTAACVDAAGMPIGIDCDDTDPSIFPGNVEICDGLNRDEDCAPSTFGYRDLDDDGVVDATCCNGTSCGTDCNDAVRGIGPDAIEICNGIDDDCDGTVDEDAQVPGYLDRDRDGRGDASMPIVMGCVGAIGFSLYDDDCNDANVNVNGAQPEFCDTLDNDCDGRTDEGALPVIWYPDVDGDGFGDPRGASTMSCAPIANRSILATDCNDGRTDISPRAPELCNGVDDDCNGSADFFVGRGDTEDDDRDGVPDAACAPGRDCDDRDPGAAAGLQEICNERDDDCDGVRDEGCVECTIDAHCDGGRCVGNVCETSCGAAGACPDGQTCCGDACVDTMRSSAHCGGCDRSCLLFSAFAGCTDGACTVSSCRSPFEDCDGVADNGCEIDTTRSTLHCGACGRMCVLPHAAPTCAARACRIASCEGGWLDCNGIPEDGCEVDLRNDDANCGVCARACAPTRNATAAACQAGGCEVTACAPNWQDCDGDATNGCENGADPAMGASCRNVMATTSGGFPVVTGGDPLLFDGNNCMSGSWTWGAPTTIVNIDLGPGPHALSRLVGLFGPNQGGMQMYVSADGVTYERVYNADAQPPEGIAAVDLPMRNARYVRFHLIGGFFAPWTTRELQVWECP